MRWVNITKEFLPANEQALRAVDALTGDAALELEEVEDSRYDQEQGIQTLLADLEISFGEKELFRKGGRIREFESLVRVQGESVNAFVRRFRLMERKLKDAQLPQYPEETRAVKLLDGLKLEERATAQLLLAAGNKYNFQALLDAIKIQYPPGLTLTGLARHQSTAPQPVRRGRGGHPKGRGRLQMKWKTWNTAVDEFQDEPTQEPEPDHEAFINDIQDFDIEPNDDTFDYQFDEEEEADWADAEPGEDGNEADAINANEADDHQAYTATSKKLATSVQARGYYTNATMTKGKGKSSSSHSGGKGKEKGDGKKGSSFSSSSFSNPKGRGKGSGSKGSKGKGKGSATHKHRLQSSLCLGCGSSEHWLRECPHVSAHQAHLCASMAPSMDESGNVIWMTQHDELQTTEAATQTDPPMSRGLLTAAMSVPVISQPPRSSSGGYHTPNPTDYTSCESPCTSPRPPSSLGDLNPDDWEDMLEENHWIRELAADCRRELASLNQQERGEDPRTSKATVSQETQDCRTAQPSVGTGQYRGADPRTAKVSRNKVGPKQEWAGDPRTPRSGAETQELPKVGLGEPRTLVGLDYLAPEAPVAASSSAGPPNGRMALLAATSFDDTISPRRDSAIEKMQKQQRSKSADPLPRHTWTWMVSFSDEVEHITFDAEASAGETEELKGNHVHGQRPNRKARARADPMYKMPPLSSSLVLHCQEPNLAIVDTGCQRQVAGADWHQHHAQTNQLPRLFFEEKAQFRFGPSAAIKSTGRYAYACGVGHQFVVLFFSHVDVEAPALLSRQTMTTLDAFPDITAGRMVYRALGTSSPLYLSSCGHLAVRLDEWPSELPVWPCQLPFTQHQLPDVWAPTASPVKAQVLPSARHPAVRPPLHGSEGTSTEMAAQLAILHGEPPEVCGERVSHGDPLCLDQPEAQPERQSAPPIWSSIDGSHHADDHRSSDSAEPIAQ